ncbi:MAG: amidohydrolase family protein [Acetobacteraceae bacterium]|nr:amidohydrolase family protein [Acetobacteraceae bacterium]
MATRRGFLAAAMGGLGFCGCCLRPAPVRAAESVHLPVTIAGKRVRTIDTHSHCYFQDAIDLMGPDAAKVLPPVKGVPEHFLAKSDVLHARFAQMDAMGIDMEVLSINPFWYGTDRSTATQITELQNDHMAELHSAHPERLQFFASLALQFPDLAVMQLEDAVRNKHLAGAAVGASMLGESLANPRFHPVWAKAEELGATIFIHPQSTPELGKRFAGNGWLSNVIGNPLETTICLEQFIFTGMLDKFPRLKLLAAHGGGYLGANPDRGDHSCFVSPQNCDPAVVLKKKPSEYVRQMHFDALVFTPEALRHLCANVGWTQVVLGTDHPIPWEQHPVDLIMATKTLSETQKIAILGQNAMRLLKTAV